MTDRERTRLRKQIEAANLSQREVARRAGVSPAHLCFVLGGKRDSKTLVRKIREILAEEKEAAHA